MKSLFDDAVREEVLQRIESLTPASVPSWGKMSVGQMCTHCQKPLQLAMGKIALTGKKPGFMKRLVFKIYKPLMYNDKAWTQNLPTVRDFVVSDERELETEKGKLAALVTEFHQYGKASELPTHPTFGKFTREQWGKMQYKHLHHHLSQFDA